MPGGIADSTHDAKKAALEAKEAALDARESTLDAADAAAKAELEKESKKPEPKVKPGKMPPPAISDEKRITDEQMLSLLKAQIPANGHKACE